MTTYQPINLLREIMAHATPSLGTPTEFGNAIYYDLSNGRKAKLFLEGNGHAYVTHAFGVSVTIIGDRGTIDTNYFAFDKFFCEPDVPANSLSCRWDSFHSRDTAGWEWFSDRVRITETGKGMMADTIVAYCHMFAK